MNNLASLIALVSMITMVQAECMIKNTTNNFIKPKLEGNWTFNPTMTELLSGPESAKGVVGQMVIEFNDDESVLEEMSEDNCNFLALNNLDILMAGVLRFFHIQVGVIAHTFILTSEDGIPVFIYWSPGAEGIMTPVVSYFSLIPAAEHRNDLLFIGGRKSTDPFNALQRVEREFMLVVEDNTPRQ